MVASRSRLVVQRFINKHQCFKEVIGILVTDDACIDEFITFAIAKYNTRRAEEPEAREKSLILFRIGCYISL